MDTIVPAPVGLAAAAVVANNYDTSDDPLIYDDKPQKQKTIRKQPTHRSVKSSKLVSDALSKRAPSEANDIRSIGGLSAKPKSNLSRKKTKIEP